MTTSTPEKQDGLKALSDAIEVIQSKITSLGGVFNVQMAVSFPNDYGCLILTFLYAASKNILFFQPKVVTATDEAELARQMERAELENAEVAGDDDEEEVEGMEGDFSGGEGTEQNNKIEFNNKGAEHNDKERDLSEDEN